MRPPPTWHPKGTYGLLAAIGAVFLLEFVTLFTLGAARFFQLWTITPSWYLQPWSIVTSTLAHSPDSIAHILFNGLILFFFGPILERILGTKRFVWLFLLAGAISGIVQVTIQNNPALGASGALMMTFGALVVIMPREKLLIYGIIPVPFWVAGIGYAVLDILGVFTPGGNIGNFAHLSGMALGLWLGWHVRQRVRPRWG